MKELMGILCLSPSDSFKPCQDTDWVALEHKYGIYFVGYYKKNIETETPLFPHKHNGEGFTEFRKDSIKKK